MRVCPDCHQTVDVRHRCRIPEKPVPSPKARAREKELGRTSYHWRRRVLPKTSKRPGARCANCGSDENLTSHYRGDHSKAKPAHVLVLCRRCHGKVDGARRLAT